MSASDPQHVPSRVRARFDEIVAVTDAVAARHLDADYAALCRFSQVGVGWRAPGELTEALVLPGVRDALRVSRHFDLPALILETRFLRPLTGFGLAEARSAPREPGAPIARSAYRKSPLFDRAVRFRVASDGGAGRPPDER